MWIRCKVCGGEIKFGEINCTCPIGTFALENVEYVGFGDDDISRKDLEEAAKNLLFLALFPRVRQWKERDE